MTKNEAFKNFKESYERLSDSDRDAFSRISLKLLDETFLVKERDEDRKDYLKANDLINGLRAYFAFIDYDLVNDAEKGVIYIRTELDSNRVHLRKLETIILLVLRRLAKSPVRSTRRRSIRITSAGPANSANRLSRSAATRSSISIKASISARPRS